MLCEIRCFIYLLSEIFRVMWLEKIGLFDMRSRLKDGLHWIYCGFLRDKHKWLKIYKIFEYLCNFDIVLDCISVKIKWFMYFWLWLVVKTFMDLKALCQEIYLTIIFLKDCFFVVKVESEIFVRHALKFDFNRVEFGHHETMGIPWIKQITEACLCCDYDVTLFL